VLRVNSRVYESRFSQHAQMLGYRGLRETELRFEIADGALGSCKEQQDGAAARLGKDMKFRFHGYYIPLLLAYTCQGILRRLSNLGKSEAGSAAVNVNRRNAGVILGLKTLPFWPTPANAAISRS
jgi:hypothetical protein